LETNAENLEKQLDLLENKGERTEKHDSLYAFLKSPEQVLNSYWKKMAETQKSPVHNRFLKFLQSGFRDVGKHFSKTCFTVFRVVFHRKNRVMPGFSSFSTFLDGE